MLKPIPPTRDDTWAAAAGIKSNLRDLAKWVSVQLARGKIDDTRRLFSESVANDMWQVTTPNRVTSPPAPLAGIKANIAGYGLGWELRDYRGRTIVSHTGGLTGMVTLVRLIPSEQLGIVVLTNQEEGGAFDAIAYHIVDAYLGAPPTDWIAAYRQVRDDRLKKANDEEQKQAAARNRDSSPSLRLEAYAGEYVDAWYERMDDVRAVMDAVGSERAYVMGVSERGPLSALFAATYPERTLGLIIFGANACDVKKPDYPWGVEPDQVEEISQNIRTNWGTPEATRRRFDAWLAPSRKGDEALIDWFGQVLRNAASPGAAVELFRMNCLIDVRPALASVHCPTLVLRRQGDMSVSDAEARYMAGLIPGAKYVELPGIDHMEAIG